MSRSMGHPVLHEIAAPAAARSSELASHARRRRRHRAADDRPARRRIVRMPTARAPSMSLTRSSPTITAFCGATSRRLQRGQKRLARPACRPARAPRRRRRDRRAWRPSARTFAACTDGRPLVRIAVRQPPHAQRQQHVAGIVRAARSAARCLRMIWTRSGTSASFSPNDAHRCLQLVRRDVPDRARPCSRPIDDVAGSSKRRAMARATALNPLCTKRTRG